VGRRGCLDTLALARPVGAAAGPRWRRGWTFAKRVIASGEGDTPVIVVDAETARPASPRFDAGAPNGSATTEAWTIRPLRRSEPPRYTKFANWDSRSTHSFGMTVSSPPNCLQ